MELENQITGKVIDSYGNPVSGAVINLDYILMEDSSSSKIISNKIREENPTFESLFYDNLLLKTRAPYDRTDSASTISLNGSVLYFGINIPEDERLSYQLPPKPPEGAFDVRFSGNMSVCNCDNMPCEIEIMNNSNTLNIDYQIVLGCYWETCEGFNWVLENPDTNERHELVGSGGFTLSGVITSLLLYHDHSDNVEIYSLVPNPFQSSTNINYKLPEESGITLWVTDYCETKTLAVLEDGIGEIGCNQVVWDGKDTAGNQVANGAYLVNLQVNDFTEKELIFLLDINSDTSDDNIVTNDNGRFSISQNCLPFGFSSEEYFVSRYVNIIASHNSYETNTLSTVFIDPHSGADVTIQLQLQ